MLPSRCQGVTKSSWAGVRGPSSILFQLGLEGTPLRPGAPAVLHPRAADRRVVIALPEPPNDAFLMAKRLK